MANVYIMERNAEIIHAGRTIFIRGFTMMIDGIYQSLVQSR